MPASNRRPCLGMLGNIKSVLITNSQPVNTMPKGQTDSSSKNGHNNRSTNSSTSSSSASITSVSTSTALVSSTNLLHKSKTTPHHNQLDPNKSPKTSSLNPIRLNYTSSLHKNDPIALDNHLSSIGIVQHITNHYRDKFGNVLLKPKSVESISLIIEATKKASLSAVNYNDPIYNPAIIICGLTFEAATLQLNNMRNQGIHDLIEIKRLNNDTSHVINKVKAICTSRDSQQQLLEEGFIQINERIKLKVEPVIKSPTQCKKCHRFDHIAAKCNELHHLCPKCGNQAHSEMECPNKSTCINCKGEHSALNRKCPEYRNLFNGNRRTLTFG